MSTFKECFNERCPECSEEVDGNFCSKCERKLEAGVDLLKEAADQVKRMDLSLKFEGGLEEEIKPSQMEVAPLHRTLVISHKRRLFKNTKGI